MAEVDLGQALDWEGIVIDDGPSFELLDAGYYPFRVESLERERFDGSAKMASCPRAKLTLKVTAGDDFSFSICYRCSNGWALSHFCCSILYAWPLSSFYSVLHDYRQR